MTLEIGQLSYSLDIPVANPGQLADLTVNQIESMPAAEAINPGRLLEVASDGVSCQQVQATSVSTTTHYAGAVGVSVQETAREGLGVNNFGTTSGGTLYNVGDMVPVLRRGTIFMEWKGTTQTAFGLPNVYHSSTTAADRGKLTDAAGNDGAGTEVSPCPSGIQLKKALTGTGSIALVSVNFPGAV